MTIFKSQLKLIQFKIINGKSLQFTLAIYGTAFDYASNIKQASIRQSAESSSKAPLQIRFGILILPLNLKTTRRVTRIYIWPMYTSLTLTEWM